MCVCVLSCVKRLELMEAAVLRALVKRERRRVDQTGAWHANAAWNWMEKFLGVWLINAHVSCEALQWGYCWGRKYRMCFRCRRKSRARSWELPGFRSVPHPVYTLPLHHVRLVQRQAVDRRALGALELLTRCHLHKGQISADQQFTSSWGKLNEVNSSEMPNQRFKINVRTQTREQRRQECELHEERKQIRKEK